jgi:hypothetical protein
LIHQNEGTVSKMKWNIVLRTLLKATGISISTWAARSGKSGHLYSVRLMQPTTSVENYMEMLRGLDYKLVAVPRDRRTLEEKGEYEIG